VGVIYILISVSITVAVLFFIVFVYAVKTGQFEDAYTPSVRMLFEDEVIKKVNKSKTNK